MSFEEAAQRAAQISHDLQFGGLAMLFNGPSEGATCGIRSTRRVRPGRPHFHAFLTLALSELGTRALNLIAHRMGNEVLADGLAEFDTWELGAA